MAASTGQSILIAVWTLTAVSCIFLGLRLYCKSFRHAKYGADDWVLAASWVRLPSQMYISLRVLY